MFKQSYKEIVSSLLCFLLVISPMLRAQDMVFDFDPPAVVHQEIEEVLPGGTPQIISAKVTDNVLVKSVVLYYRNVGSDTFKQVDMRQEGTSSIYLATISENDAIEPGVEYYIEASDESGNLSSEGVELSPLILALSASTDVLSAGNQPEDTATLGNKKWLWIGLGVLAVGGVLAASGGGGGGSGETSTGSGDPVPISLTVSPP